MSMLRALRIVLALALLSAQQAALSHQLWHLLDHGKQPAQQQLCDQHDALGTVAGAMDAPLALARVDAPDRFSDPYFVLPAAQSAGLAPSSRGPPASL